MGRFNDIVLLIFRVGSSLLMLPHGWAKVQQLLNEEYSFANPIGIGEVPTLFLAAFTEFIAPLFIILGFKTRIMAAGVFCTMMAAALIVHRADPLADKEMALLYGLIFGLILAFGPGKFAISSGK